MTLAQIDRAISVAGSYTSSVSRDQYTQPPFEAHCSTQLTQTGKNYGRTLGLVPAGYRMSVLEEIACLIQQERWLKANGRDPRKVLNDPLFRNFIQYDSRLREWTHIFLRAPNGHENFEGYVERDGQGREYCRADYGIGDEVVAEGVLVPKSWGEKIVEWNEALRIPAAVSDGNEPQHTSHFYFWPEEKEVAVGLMGHQYYGGRGRCLDISVSFGRSLSTSGGAFRLFEGSLDEVPFPIVNNEIAVKASK